MFKRFANGISLFSSDNESGIFINLGEKRGSAGGYSLCIHNLKDGGYVIFNFTSDEEQKALNLYNLLTGSKAPFIPQHNEVPQ